MRNALLPVVALAISFLLSCSSGDSDFRRQDPSAVDSTSTTSYCRRNNSDELPVADFIQPDGICREPKADVKQPQIQIDVPDIYSPLISIVSPAYPGLTNAETFTFRGRVSDPQGDPIGNVTIKDSSGVTIANPATTNGEWSQILALTPGRNRFTLEAADGTGAVGTATAEITRELFLDGPGRAHFDAATNSIFFMATNSNGFAPMAVVAVDLGTKARRIVSGEGVGAGPVFDGASRMIRHQDTGELFAFNQFPVLALRIDSVTGDRSLLADLSSIGSIRGVVVDESNDRLLVLNSSNGLTSVALSDGSISSLGSIVLPIGGSFPREGLAISADGALLYILTPTTIAEVNTSTLATSEWLLDEPPDSTTDHILDEAQNRIIYTHRGSIISVDRASGNNTVLAVLPGDVTLPEFITLGRSPTELIIADQFDDLLLTLDLETAQVERLAGSFRGEGPSMDDVSFVYDPVRELVFSTVETRGAQPEDTTWDLLQIDPITGDRNRIATDFGQEVLFAITTGLAIDENGDILWSTAGVPSALFRFDATTGIGEEVAPLTGQFGGGSWLCYDAGSAMAYTVKRFADQEIFAINTVDGSVGVLSSGALGIGNGPAPILQDGIACDSANAQVLTDDTNTATASVYGIDQASGDRRIISGPGLGIGDPFLWPDVLAVSTDGLSVFVRDHGDNRLLRVDLATGDRSLILDFKILTTLTQILDAVVISDDILLLTDHLARLWAMDIETRELILVSW